jgi:cation diffusion facilitator CzcD-associated flavoprotein CzcO
MSLVSSGLIERKTMSDVDVDSVGDDAAPATATVDAIVIGTGFGGLYAVHKLRNELGLNVQAFDNAGGVGGTWYWNTYPGARSDTEVTAYCYSFDRELFESWRWTERYPRQPEILRYLNHVAERYDLLRSIQFRTTVESATFDEDSGRWTVVTSDGGRWSTQFLVEGVGLLSSTNYPDLPGLSSFTGQMYHSARWPRDGVDLTGKRVGVIGTGSTGVQIITAIAPEVEHLTVFQRTPQYTVPAKHRPIDPRLLEKILADYDGYWNSVRSSLSAFGFKESEVTIDGTAPEEREAAFERQWNSGGGFQFMLGVYSDVIVNRESNSAATDFIRKKIREIVRDPETAAALSPTELYARRPLCDDGYYETFNRDNVSLVDIKADPILAVTPKGIRTELGEVELDVIVFATGFDAFTGNYLKIDQRGRGGVSLRDRWADRPRTFMGVMTAGLPNWFMIFGPMCPFTNQPPAHEVEVDWIAGAIQYARAAGADTIEVTVEAENAWMDTCDELAAGTLFPEVDSWINGANIPGKPKAVMVYMGGMGAYTEELARVARERYDGLTLAKATQLAR